MAHPIPTQKTTHGANLECFHKCAHFPLCSCDEPLAGALLVIGESPSTTGATKLSSDGITGSNEGATMEVGLSAMAAPAPLTGLARELTTRFAAWFLSDGMT